MAGPAVNRGVEPVKGPALRQREDDVRTTEYDAAVRLTIFVLQTDHYRHRPVYCEIVRRAHRRGLAGASVFRGLEGFGAAARIHRPRSFSLSSDLPIVIVIVDTEERIQEFLPEVNELVSEGLVTLDQVQVVRYTADEHKTQSLTS
jgi:PII-like signaling protein